MIEIREVKGKKMLRDFIDFPVRLYKGNPYFTPYLYEDEIENLTPGKNPQTSHCIFKLLLAYKDGKIAGRICGIINKYANTKYNQKRVRFNRIDMIDDIEVTKALIKSVEQFGLEYELEEIVGPLGYSDQDKEGMLTFGFDQKNTFMTFYTHEYYVEHLKKLGFVQDAEWKEYRVPIPKEIDPLFTKLSELCQRRFKLKPVQLKKHENLKPYVEEVLSLTNKCYADLYGYVPYSKEEMHHLAAQYLPMIDPKYLPMVYNEQNQLIAYGLMIHTPVDALKRHNGHLFPFGFIDFLHEIKHSKVLDMLLVAVDPDYRDKGALAIILEQSIKNAIADGIEYAETGPTLTENKEIQAMWARFNRIHHKTRACFIKPIEK